MKMTTEEAFVKVLQMHGIEHAFGIIGSAFMPISDLFPQAGITFWDVAHETNGGLICDGYTRSTGKMAMAIAQNGPGITGFVTPIKTAYWNHTPMLLVTPQAANKTIGQGGFQEVEQMALFRDMVCYQEEVRDPSRVAEVLNRVILKAKRLSAPAQINIPRDFWTQVIDINLPAIVEFERPAGGDARRSPRRRSCCRRRNSRSSCRAPASCSATRSPTCVALAEKLDAPVCNNYQHNDSFPGSHPLAVGPLGYNGSKAAMELIAKADVVLALGTRLNPFSTLPGYGIDYWPKTAKIIQVDINADRIGLTKPVTVGICGDAKLVAEAHSGAALAQRRQCRPRGAQGADPHDQVEMAADALQHGSRGRRSGHDLERRTRASATRIACRRVRPGARSRRVCRATPSSPATSATIARSATPIRPSRRAANIWRRACSGRAATASRRSSAPRSAIPTRRASASPATARSAFR